MKILITCIGNSDPIRMKRDGALLHIARIEQPDKIILIHSEHSEKRESDIIYALNHIDSSYQPEVVVEQQKIYNVAYYDRVYTQLAEIIQNYVNDEDEFILNLSSGTPQMNGAFFALNQIYDYGFRGIQVMTPAKGPNIDIKHDNDKNIKKLVETNKDNQEGFKNRLIEDKAEKFSQILTIRNFITLIDHYDYVGAQDLVKKQKGFPYGKKIINELDEIISNLHQNKLPADIESLDVEHSFKKALFNFLIIQMKFDRGETADALVRIQSIVEYMAAYYLMDKYPDILYQRSKKNFLNAKKYPDVEKFLIADQEAQGKVYRETYLGLGAYHNILRNLEAGSKVYLLLNYITQVRGMRNSIAHNLGEISGWNQRRIEKAYETTEELLKEIFDFDYELLNYYDKINQKIKEYLN